jgi:hypothetical protein
MRKFRFALAPLPLALLLAGCATPPRARPDARSEAAQPGQMHRVTLVIDGKVVGQWTTTGKVEVNGAAVNGIDATPTPPALRELPQ